MAYDQELAARIRALIGDAPEVAEKKMFGGLAFLVRGNMAIAAGSEGGVLVRVDPAQTDHLVTDRGARIAEMRGRAMAGWLRVQQERLASDADLAFWVETGTRYAGSLPPKR